MKLEEAKSKGKLLGEGFTMENGPNPMRSIIQDSIKSGKTKSTKQFISEMQNKGNTPSIRSRVLETGMTTGTVKPDIGDIGRLTQSRIKQATPFNPKIDSFKTGIEIKNPNAVKLGPDKLTLEAKKFTIKEFLNVYKYVDTKEKLTRIWKKANK
jgi:hypothetical protein